MNPFDYILRALEAIGAAAARARKRRIEAAYAKRVAELRRREREGK